MRDELVPFEDDHAIYLLERLFKTQGNMPLRALNKLQGSYLCMGPTADKVGSSAHLLA